MILGSQAFSLTTILMASIAGLVIPCLLDIVILNFLLHIQKKSRLIITAIIANVLIFIGNVLLKVPMKDFFNSVSAYLLNIDKQDPSNFPTLMLLKNNLLPLTLTISIFIIAGVKILIYKKTNPQTSLKDLSLGVLLSVLLNILIGAVLLTCFFYYFLAPLALT